MLMEETGTLHVRCPYCLADDDRVVDTRANEEATLVRRRRECNRCSRRFTTFEKVEEIRLTVVKRDGMREGFDRAKIIGGLMAALKNRPFTTSQIEQIALDIEEDVRSDGDECTSSEIGLKVLNRLHTEDEVGYIRFASVYKGFKNFADFEREADEVRRSSLAKRSQEN